jgi:ADP-ribose pyrophosphatase
VSEAGSTRVYDGRVISVDLDTVEFPNGTTGQLEMVRHPGASAVSPFLENEGGPDPTILLIKQYRYAADGFLLEVPAGRLEKNESPETCAHRELREETGYSAERVELLTTFYTTPGFTDERIHLYMAFGLTEGEAALESDEILDLQPMKLSEAVGMVRTGRIVDGKSMLAILLAAARNRG